MPEHEAVIERAEVDGVVTADLAVLRLALGGYNATKEMERDVRIRELRRKHRLEGILKRQRQALKAAQAA